MPPAVAWGAADTITRLLGPFCQELRTARRTCPFRFPSAEACVDYFRTWYGPTVAAFAALETTAAEQLAGELLAMFESHNLTNDGTLAMDVA